MSVVAKTTIFRYDNLGNSLGVLDYDEATHEEDLDGLDTLTVKCRDAIGKRERLVWKDNGGYWHEHIVDSTVRDHGRNRARTTAKCSNSINELYGVMVDNEADDGTMFGKRQSTVQNLLAFLLKGTRWSVGNCGSFGAVKIEVWHKNVRECIADICTQTKGELVTDIHVDDSGVVKRVARIVVERGMGARMRQFRYGANVSGVKREASQDQVYTAIVAYGAKVASVTLNNKLAKLQEQYDEEEDTEKKKAIQKKINKVRDDIRKLNANEYAERITVKRTSTRKDAAAIKSVYGVPNASGGVDHHWMTYTDSGCTDGTFLEAQAVKVLRAHDYPVIYYEFDVAQVGDDLWRDVRLGNHVLCLDAEFAPTLELDERVSYISRSLSGRMRCTIGIGERANPLVQQYQANNNLHRATTGNKTPVNAAVPPSNNGAYIGNDGQAIEGWDEEGYDGDMAQPAGIKITVPPSKIDYVDGEEIDYNGMMVILIDAYDELFIDDAHPDGVIPNVEQTRPIATASTSTIPASHGWKVWVDDTSGLNQNGVTTMPLSYNETSSITLRSESNGGTNWDVLDAGDAVYSFTLVYNSDPTSPTSPEAPAFCSKEPFKIRLQQIVEGNVFWTGVIDAQSYTYNGKTVYYWNHTSIWTYGQNLTFTPPNAVINQTEPGDKKRETAWNLLYAIENGQIEGPYMVPVQWGGFEDSFQINITSSPISGGNDVTNNDAQYWYGDPELAIEASINLWT